jgi:ATP-dependent DNA helicase RecG
MSSTVEVERALQGPEQEAGPSLAAVPEDQWFDRKSIRIKPRELADSLIGFANADGGTIVVGLRDGTVEGIDGKEAHVNALTQAAIDFCQPPVRAESRLVGCVAADGDPNHLLLFDIQPGETVHSNVRDEVFLRIGDENRRLSFGQRQELLYDRGHGSYESRAVPGASIDAVNEGVLHAYAAALEHPAPQRLLQARGLAAESLLTIAGLLLFAEHPQRFVPEGFVRVLRYRGTERGTGARQQVVGDLRFEGPLAVQLVEARKAVREMQPTRRALTASGRFDDVALVPEDAWLEGLVNAVVHRSYSLAGDHIRLEIFDDRIEVESPGRFPGLVNPDDPLGAPRYARNPRIARVCADQNFGQELGEGIRRMFEEMRSAGLADPLYEQTPASVRLTLSAEPRDRELDLRLPRDSRVIVAALRDAGRLSTGEVAEILVVSRVTAGDRLRALRDAGLVAWTGKSPTDPRASWSLPPT